MSRKIEMTPEQASLFSQMKRLSKQANQRIVRLERLTGDIEPFSVKQLSDYLSSETLNAWTKKGRVTSSKSLTPLQMKAVIKATKRFLGEETSRVQGAKEYVKEISTKAGKEIPINLASTYYKATKDYKWILQYMSESAFWDFARECVKNNYSYETFKEKLSGFHKDLEKMCKEEKIDEAYHEKLTALYEFIQGVKV